MTIKRRKGKVVYIVAGLVVIVFLAAGLTYLLSSSPMTPLPVPTSFTVGSRTFAFSSYAPK